MCVCVFVRPTLWSEECEPAGLGSCEIGSAHGRHSNTLVFLFSFIFHISLSGWKQVSTEVIGRVSTLRDSIISENRDMLKGILSGAVDWA